MVHKTYSNNFLKFDCESKIIIDKCQEKYFSKEIVSSFDPTRITKITKKGIIIPNEYIIIRLHENMDSDFIVFLLKSDIFTRELNKLIEGSLGKWIKINHMREVKLPIPDYNNQKEYGNLLRLLENKIQLKLKSIENNKKAQQAILDKLVSD